LGVVLADTATVIHFKYRRSIGRQVESLQLGLLEGRKQVSDELLEITFEKLIARRGLANQAEARQAEAVAQEPLVDFRLDFIQPTMHVRRVGRNDQELARRVGDLAGRRQAQGL
jgi:hypothetical protein